MTNVRRRVARLGPAIALLVVTAGLVLFPPATAPVGAEVVITDPSSGATITLSSGQVSPGERIQIHGEGFTPTSGSQGEPLVAVRPYDFDTGSAWTIGGEDAYDPAANGNPTAAAEAKYWFITDHTDNGSFDGWLQAPADLTRAGPLGNGDHWLRILSGAFFTTSGDRLTEPITFKVPISFADHLTTGLTSPTGIFQQGTYFRPGAQLTVRGRGYQPEATVTVELDAAPLPTAITTGPDGALPSTARVALPATTTPGPHTLTLRTGSIRRSISLTVTPTPSATVLTPAIRPGGQVAYDLADYIGVSGQPQKIAIVVREQVLACLQADARGDASGVISLPGDLDGSAVVGFNVGLSCVLPPAGVIDDQPVSRIAPTVTISDTAPQVAVAGPAPTGGPVPVTGAGFVAGSTVTITIGDDVSGTLTADGDGRISGSVGGPRTPGDFRLLAQASEGPTAATLLTVQEPVTSRVTLREPGPLSYGAARTVAVELAVDGQPASGSVIVTQGDWSRSVTVSPGGTTVRLPASAAAGRHTVTASYAGASGIAGATASRDFTVSKAKTRTTLRLSKRRTSPSARVTATVGVRLVGSAPGVAPVGRVVLLDGARRLATGTLKADRGGTLKIRLPRLTRRGVHRLRAVYQGDRNAESTTSTIVTIRVG